MRINHGMIREEVLKNFLFEFEFMKHQNRMCIKNRRKKKEHSSRTIVSELGSYRTKEMVIKMSGN